MNDDRGAKGERGNILAFDEPGPHATLVDIKAHGGIVKSETVSQWEEYRKDYPREVFLEAMGILRRKKRPIWPSAVNKACKTFMERTK